MKEGGGRLRRLRCDGDRITRRLFAITRCQERHRTFVGRAVRLVNALVKLRRDGEYQREKKRADKSRGHDRPQCNHLAVYETQFHCAGV